MSSHHSNPTSPSPGALAAPPHWHSREVLQHVSGVTLAALSPVIGFAAVLYGWWILVHTLVAVISALLCGTLLRAMLHRGPALRQGHTAVLAVVLVLTLPPTAGLGVTVLGTAIMVLAVELFGGIGHYLWHPVLVARAILSFAFAAAMLPDYWPILNQEHVFTGHLQNAEPLQTNISWLDRRSAPDAEAWVAPRPVEILCDLYRPSNDHRPATTALLDTLRRRLPPALDCAIGTTGGGLGETSVVMILLGGLVLVYRGYVHWTLPFGAVLGLLLTAAILPIADSLTGKIWWPLTLRQSYAGQVPLPIGLVFVSYHLLVGEFIFAVLFVASDMTASPLRTRGHLYFGLAIGILTVVLRSAGFAPGATYWSILIMNTFIPVINRLTRPRVYGT